MRLINTSCFQVASKFSARFNYAGVVPTTPQTPRSARRAPLAPRPLRTLRRVRRVRAKAAALLTLAVLALSSAPLAANAAENPTHPGTSAAAVTVGAGAQSSKINTKPGTNLTGERVVLIAASGVRWADVDEKHLPTIYRFAHDAAIGNIITRSVYTSSCALDGWLGISAGNRAGDAINGAGGACRYLEEPTQAIAGQGVTNATTPNWQAYQDAVDSQKYNSVLGSFGDQLEHANIPVAGVGPGAAVALANAQGNMVGTFYSRPAVARDIRTAVTAGLEATAHGGLLVVDAGHVRVGRGVAASDPVIQAQAQELDARVDATLAAIRADDPTLEHTTILLTSLGDPVGSPRMGAIAMAGHQVAGNILTSPSTRQTGFSQVTDLPTTLFSLLGVDHSSAKAAFVGSVIAAGYANNTVDQRINKLVDTESHALAARPLVSTFYMVFCVVNIALFVIVAYVFSGRFLRRVTHRGSWVANHSRALIRACEVAGLTLAALPVGSLLANLVPWWRTGSPGTTLVAVTVTIIALLVCLSKLPLWRGWRFGPMAVIALVTAVVLAADVVTGATLQISAPLGIQPMVGGRFYGFNNQSFTLFAVSSVLLAGAVGNEFVARGRRTLGGLAVAIIGIVVLALDGLPSFGADFGGPPALFPAFALLALIALGVKLNWKKVLAVLVAGVVVVSSFAIIDWLRPDDKRTHLGRFVDTVLDGGLFDVIGRKLAANFSTLTNPLSLVAITGILVILIVFGRPVRQAAKNDITLAPYHWLTRGVPLKQISTDRPLLQPTLYSVYVALVIGTLVNDSGVVILGVGVAVLVPLMIATYAQWILSISSVRGPLTPERERVGA